MPEVSDRRINVYLAKIDRESIISREEELIKRVSAHRREKIGNMKNPSVRTVSLAAGLLLRYALERELDKRFGIKQIFDYDISEGEKGKPFIKDLRDAETGEDILNALKSAAGYDPGIEFSISHSGDYAAVVISDSTIGIDIEVKNDTRFMVTNRMFTETEKNRVFSAEDKDSEFRDVWTEKEAYLKCTGEGISIPLRSFYMDKYSAEVMRVPDDKRESGSRGKGVYKPEDFLGTGYYITTVRPVSDNLSLSVCSKDIKFILDIAHVNDL
ncbi:MAG: 4'-phosphopantetheinyl transferase superfamily protein [Eubacterium sp.]|nr:4'-phosphopantetheinyl transferase superfamily protein [Eubacterium sp.]